MRWWRHLVRARKPWPVFIAEGLLFLPLVYLLGWWFSARYEIGIAAGKPCMPGKFYFIERRVGGLPEFQRGDLIMFRTDNRTAAYYQPGTRFIKVVRGVPGDRVRIDAAGKVRISGKDYTFTSALEAQVVALLGRKPGDLAADYTIKRGSYFVMGTLPDSYDSRYWGLVMADQVAGKGLAVIGK